MKLSVLLLSIAAISSATASEATYWWTLFNDPVLDELASRARVQNQDLQAAVARLEQARAAAGVTRSDYWPQLAAAPDGVRERMSSTTDNVFPHTRSTTYRAPLVAAWEIDLFGRVRHLSARARAEAEAAASEFEAVRLALTSDVAAGYFSLRALEREQALLRDTADLRRRAVELTRARYRSGVAAELDVARAETELATTEAELSEIENRRAALQHALAVLVGVPASEFVLADNVTEPTPVSLPPDLPAALLDRRPDVAAAERRLAAATARIGVAKAAFYPAISLVGAAGYASGETDTLFNADSRLWSFGPSIYLPLFQGGRNRANLARARAGEVEAAAEFRQTVLLALRDVHDALTATRLLGEQAAAQERALGAAQRAVRLAQTRYDAGFVSYFEVIDTQRTALAIERRSVQLGALRLNTNVALIKAIGGGWDATTGEGGQ